MKNFLIKISIFCAALIIFPLGMSAQKYIGSYDGRTCTLDMSEHKSYGNLEFDPDDADVISLPEGRDVNCEGTLEIYVGGYMNFNLLALEFTSDTDQTQHYLAAPDWASSPDETITICLKYGPNKTVTVWDQSKNPYFGKVKLKLSK